MMLFLKRSTLYGLFCCTLMMTVVMVKTGSPLKTPATPSGIINLEFASNMAKIETVLQTWQKASTPATDVIAAAKFNTALDFIYLLCYSLFLFTCCKQLSVLLKQQTVLSLWLEKFALVALLAGILDIMENFGMLQALSGEGSDFLAKFTTIVSIIKWFLVIVVLILIIAGLYLKTTLNRRQPL